MKSHLRKALAPIAALTLAVTAAPSAMASPVPFNASYTGVAQVVGVVNPAGPVLRFETQAHGSGPFDLGSYFSTDVIDMSTGVGNGINVFTSSNGDELHGIFSVQVIPTALSHIVDLIGQATFTGGTGLFSGASGSAVLTGRGVFAPDGASAQTLLEYRGTVSLVPEPGSALLVSGGLLALALRGRRQLGDKPGP
jgi:hypothetical protein